ncbi:MAG: NusA antitermination factor [Berkelbacteria bacterium GW2011_GWB1_38_5]|uniref:Transcription termination/antitermination protein NusA n=2 Tax=Candidatus Berkelbacteria TaxID=1618330 RepID=A0A0G0PNE8_9BACT|nr:MAG: NusA antitermination factor [Berkelbacteria bacterium GW2011_GWB1_38_5]KKQ90846.1 MAG: NusA antitermination factor [Berkelbacteria bacterium GW2011_GWA1_39_10]
MAISPFMAAINQICDEKGLSKDTVMETIEAAIAAAYRKDFGKPSQIIKVKMDPESGQTQVWQVFDVTEEIEEPESQKTLGEAKKIDKKTKVGEQVQIALESKSEFGRIAAQTAKQVIIQRIREAERDMLYKEFKDKESKIVNGVVQQIEGNNVIIDLGKLNGLMLPSDQIPHEKYYSGQRLRVFVKGVEESSRGPRVLVSRTDSGLILGLFELEVPEIPASSVEIKGIAREAGSRSKVAVWTSQEGLDPVGSCVGQRGTRIQAVLAEIGEEKIDIILWNEKDEQYVINALSPAKVEKVKLNKKEQKAIVQVADDQLSLAIGKGGQNVRLASKLTGWSLDIEKIEEKKKVEKEETLEAGKGETEEVKAGEPQEKEAPKKTKKVAKKTKKKATK